MKKLSRATVEIVRCLFAPDDQEKVARIVATECGENLAFLENQSEEGLEPVRFAVLKLSRGNVNELQWWVALAKQDWPDVLRAAGFSPTGDAHRQWAAGVYYGRKESAPNKT